jgi:hypothetical protein
MKILVALMLTLAKGWFYSLGKIGDGTSPFWILLIITILCSLVSRSNVLAFTVGFLSFTALPLGVFWFYYVRGSLQLLDLNGWLASFAWAFLFGLIGPSAVKISKSVSASRFRTAK